MGELAALVTSICWSFTSIQFTLAGQRIGSQAVNRVRLILATLFLSLTHLLLYGELWPIHAEPFRWGWLGLSGIVGLVLGDACLFHAFLLIGPRRALLMYSLVPVFSTLVAWGWLGETLAPAEIGAVLLTVGGIAWVVSERKPGNNAAGAPSEKYLLGLTLSVGAALGQSLGLVISKQGLIGDFPPLSATLIRMLVASATIWLFALVRKQVSATGQALMDKRALAFTAGGALTGPTLGIWLSMVAIQATPVGIASTLMALPPILLIPLERWIFHEQVSSRAVVGTVVALVGAAAIFMM
jgi:drug/metabolite transporter (DMT)-like permease